MGFTLAEDEKDLGGWTVNYRPPGGGRYSGKLVVTDRRLLFDARFDTSLTGAWKELIVFEGGHGYLEIAKASMRSVEVRSGVLGRRVVVILNDGSEHTFDYGLLSMKKIASAIEAR